MIAHTPCNSERCPIHHPALAAVNHDLDTIEATAGWRDDPALAERHAGLLDERWRMLPASDLYSEAA